MPASFYIHPVLGEAIDLKKPPQFEMEITKDLDSARLGTHRAPTHVIPVASSLFKVTYKIGDVGRHFMCIMVGGKHISGSPFCVQVWQQGEGGAIAILVAPAKPGELKLEDDTISGFAIGDRLSIFDPLTNTREMAQLQGVYTACRCERGSWVVFRGKGACERD